jgi:hypothetical protein
MKILIDNQDGLGNLDYTAAVQFGKESVIRRTLNKPATCTFPVLVGLPGLRLPVSLARVQVVDRAGAYLFTGYVAGAPAQKATGVGSLGDNFVMSVFAVGDELLLNTESGLLQTTLLNQSTQASWNALNLLSGNASLPLYFDGLLAEASRVEIAAGSRWSDVASTLADSGRSAYQSLNGTATITPVGNVTHTVQADDPGLQSKDIAATDLRWLASDITVCGKEEPGAYITEIFAGDGVTTTFTLSELPFEPATAQKAGISDLFQGTRINARLWEVTDPSAHISLTGGGLTCAGGTGRDAESTVASVQQLELGGSITLEGGAVEIAAGSAGLLLGLYTGAVATANCLAGFAVSNAGGALSVAPLVGGQVAGPSFQPQAGHLYTYRLRVYSPEMERVRQSYFYLNGVGAGSFGGETVASPGQIEFEVQDVTSGIPGVSTVLYASPVAALPPAATIGLINSGTLSCSIKSVLCTQSGPVAVATGPPGGTPAPQYIAALLDGGACKTTTTGTVEFYPADIPAEGALVFVNYRSRQVAIARRAGSAASESGPAVEWIGSVTTPVPWSSVDCDNAANALLAMATQPYVTMNGTYTVALPEAGPDTSPDMWPGDALSVVNKQGQQKGWALIREVRVTLEPSMPAVLGYTVSFANDWVEALSLKVSSTIPETAVIPKTPTEIGNALASLTGLTVANLTGAVATLNTGVNAPVNGGFEIRRRDDTFGPGTDTDLVLRSATTTIAIPRAAAVEQYFVRMYDGANPPNYSLQSAAVFVNVPL